MKVAARAPRAAAAGGGEAEQVAARAANMMGPAVERELSGEQAIAWEGLLEVSRRLRRGAEEMLLERFELSISMLGIAGRLAPAPGRMLRQSALAEAMGLSLSRVSRVVDLLEGRALVERRSCPSDARATNVRLTRAGAALTARAQAELRAYVQASFHERLQESEVRVLARVFTRLLDLAPGAPDQAC